MDQRLPRWFRDRHGWIAAGLYLLVSLWYGHAVLGHFTSSCACSNTDETQWMWAWEWLQYALLHGHNPLFTDRLWSGWGFKFNLAATTLSPVTAIPGIPLFDLLGPVGAYNVMDFLAPVLNGWAAYRLCRYVSQAPAASILAGFTYGFSGYALAHMMSQVNLFLVFVPPLLLLLALRYVDGELSTRRTAIYATALLLIQFGISTEILFDMSYLGAVTLVVAWVVCREQRRQLARLALVMVIAYLVTAAIWSYYIYESFQSSLPVNAGYFSADLLSYAFPTPMVWFGGNRFLGLSSNFAPGNGFELNSYIGLPLCGILLALAFGTWRVRAAKIITISAFVAFVLSLGTILTIDGHQIMRMPYYPLQYEPLFKYAYPSRLGLFVALPAAVAAALWISWASGAKNRVWRWIVGIAAVVFLFPNIGANTVRVTKINQPRFFTAGLYKHYLSPNELVLTMPFSANGDDMVWQADAHMFFRMAGGYFGTDTPSWTAGSSLVYDMVVTTSTTASQYAALFKPYLALHHVGAVLIQDGWPGPWKQALGEAGWRMTADVGGIQVYQPVS